jgi:gliding motility-associated-like protein
MKRKITTLYLSSFTAFFAGISVVILLITCLIPLHGFSQSKTAATNAVTATKQTSVDVAAASTTTQDGKPHLRSKWMAKPFDHKVFIENKGQFNAEVNNKRTVLYEATLGGNVKAYFMPTGIFFRQITFVKDDGDKDDDKAEKDDPDAKRTPLVHRMTALWEGSNPDVTIVAGEEQSYPMTTSMRVGDKVENLTVGLFKKITYKNMYPGIDIEYIFPDGEKNGLKYTIIVHPGADLSKVKMYYLGAKSLVIDDKGDMVIKNDISDFTDHTPVSYLQEGGTASVKYMVDGNEESFMVNGSYDKTKTLVIDPWLYTGNFTFASSGNGYDLDYDNYGNVYVGGDYDPYQVAKFNSAGTELWTHQCFASDNSNSGADKTYWGDFATDKKTSEVYIGEGFNPAGSITEKVSPAGALIKSLAGTTSYQEIWRMEYNPCTSRIIIGGGGTNSPSSQVAIQDTSMTAISPANPLGTTGAGHDIVAMAMDPVGSTVYMALCQSSFDGTYNNRIMSLPIPAMSPANYITGGGDGYGFQECNSISYVGGGVGATNGTNGMAASPKGLYMYDGRTLRSYTKATGALITSLTVGPSQYGVSGLAADGCDNVYVGEGANIGIYTASLSNITVTGVGPGGKNVYCLKLGKNDQSLFVCGQGFLQEFTNPTTSVVAAISTYSNTTCGANNGMATASLSLCSGPATGVIYSWSPGGQTTQTVTGLASGTYSVNMTIGCGEIYTATVNIGASTLPTMTVNAAPSSTICSGTTTTLTASGSGGGGYTWTPATGLNCTTCAVVTAGPPSTITYTVTDAACTSYTTSIVVTVNTTPTVTLSALPSPTICSGSSTHITATGAGAGATYAWTPAGSLTNTNKDTTTAYPSTTTTYTLNATGSNACAAAPVTMVVTVNASPTIIVAAAPSANICSGTSTKITVSGGSAGTIYSWGPSTGLTNISTDTNTATPNTTTTYTISAVAAGGCFNSNSTQTIAINVTATPTVNITPATPSICPGDTATLTASGATTFKWSTGTTNDTIRPHPGDTTKYYVVGSNGACTDTAKVTLNVGKVVVKATASSPILCSGLTDTLKVNGASTYLWSNNSTATSIVVSPITTTTYTVKGTSGLGCSDEDTLVVKVNTTPTITTTAPSPGTVCPGDTIWASVVITAAGTPPYSFAWNTTPVQTTDTAVGLVAGSYSVTIKDANGCVSDTGKITIATKNITVTINSSTTTLCSGDSANLIGVGGTSYLWSTGVTNDTIHVYPTADSTFSVVGKTTGKCKDSSSVTIKVNALPTVTVKASSDSICAGYKTTLTASGASNGYVWSPIIGLSSSTGSPVSAKPGSNTWYTVTGKNAAGCTDTAGILVSVLASPTVSIGVTGGDTVCPGKSVTLTATGSPGNTFLWKPSGSSGSSIKVTPVTSPTNIMVLSSNGACTDTAKQTLYLYAPLTVSMPPFDSVCSGSSSTIGALVTGGKPAYTYVWTPSPGGNGPGPFVITPTTPVVYSVTVTDACGSTQSGSTSVGIHTSPTARFEPTPENVLGGQYVAFVDSSTNATQWLWTFGDGGTSTTSFPYYVYNLPGSYVVTLLVISKAGCRDSITDTVVVTEEIYVPNVFTPNGDGVNDVFHVTTGSIKTYSIEIYTRWGQRVFASNNPNDDWTGRSEAGIMESDGTYYYIILATDYYGKDFKYTGYLQLIGGAGEAGSN